MPKPRVGPPSSEYSVNELTRFRLRHEDRLARVLQGADPVQHEALGDHARLGPAGQREAADDEAGRREDLDTFPTPGRVRHDERAIRRDRECRRIENAAWFRADLHDLPGASVGFVDAEHLVSASIENEILARRGLLEARRIAKSPGKMGRDGVDRDQDVQSERREWGQRQDDGGKDEKFSARAVGRSRAFQYRAVSRMAFRTSRRLRQDGLFEIRAVRDRGVQRADAPDGRVEMLEAVRPAMRAAISAPKPHIT